MECPFAKRPCSGAKIAIVWGVKEVVVAATGLDGLGWDVLVVVVMEETCWVAVIRVGVVPVDEEHKENDGHAQLEDEQSVGLLLVVFGLSGERGT